MKEDNIEKKLKGESHRPPVHISRQKFGNVTLNLHLDKLRCNTVEWIGKRRR